MDLVYIIYLIDTFCEDGSPFWDAMLILPVSVLFAMVGLLLAMPILEEYEPKEACEKVVGWLKKPYLLFVGACLLGSFLNTFIPTKDTAYKMLAAYGVQEVVKNDEVQKLAGKSLLVLEKAMDSYIKEGKAE